MICTPSTLPHRHDHGRLRLIRAEDLARCSHSHSRETIVAELTTVLRNADAGITNMESAIARTSISLQEICARFGGTRELILAMASQLADFMSAPLAQAPKSTDFGRRLLEFGQRVSDIFAGSYFHGLHRIAVTESIRHTGLAREFHEVGPGRLAQRLADFLLIAQAEGMLGCADPHLLASHLLSSLGANPEVADAFLHDGPTRPLEASTHVRNVIHLFFHGMNGARPPC